MTKPYFKHDCGVCKFLGTYDYTDIHSIKNSVDLYHCRSETSLQLCNEGSVISRYGNEGRSYASSPIDLLPENTSMLDLKEAARRARKEA